MTVANATFGTRALFGAGDFAYSTCALSARALVPAFDSLLLNGSGKQAARARLKLRRSAISHPAFLSASADGFELTPELTVISRRAHEPALTASIPVPALEPGVLVSLSFPVTSRSTSLLPWSACTPLSVAKHYFSGGAASPWSACTPSGDAASFFTVTSRSTSLLPWSACTPSGGLVLPTITCRCEARHYFTSACTPSLTVTAPWFYTHARFTYTTYRDQAPCRREARHYFGGACTLPKFGRTLRL